MRTARGIRRVRCVRGGVSSTRSGTARVVFRTQLRDRILVLLIGTEGATDPSVYPNVVGKTAEQVASAA